MEYIDGNSLGDIVKTQGALPETKSVEIIKKSQSLLITYIPKI